MSDSPQDLLSAFGRQQTSPDDPNAELIAEMRKNRRVNSRRTGVFQSSNTRGGVASVNFATARPRDPMFYWEQNNLPYRYWEPGGLESIRQYSRLVQLTHPVVGAAIEVYAQIPLAGMEIVSKDDKLVEFHSNLFFDDLHYDQYLIDVGKEYWTIGEAFPLGSFNETLGVWDDDELMNPDRVDVMRSPFSKEPRLEIGLPESIRQVIQTREPAWEYAALMRSYPELRNFTSDDSRMAVSNVLLRHLWIKGDPFFPRGLPILMRGFRTLMQEEMLNAAQDAIAARLYTPLVLAKLGASATELGTDTPWVPTEGDLQDFEAALDAALAGDFRILTYHFATNISSVFGRENMPNFNSDFDRITERILQVFGLSKTMLSGAAQGETYAADAINRDIVSMRLNTYRKVIQKFFHDRAEVVAEAQEDFDYEERGGKRYIKLEEVLEIEPETGEYIIVEQPKLLVPELRLKEMVLKDEQDFRQFVEALVASGVPISQKTRILNAPIDLEEEVQRVRDEQVSQAVEAQETRKATYIALRSAGLPIPQDLIDDFAPKAQQADGGSTDGYAEDQVLPTIGLIEPADTSALVPTPEDLAASDVDVQVPVDRLPTNRIMDSTRPEESDEMRASMPKPAYLVRKVAITIDEEGIETEESEWEHLDEIEHPEGDRRLISGPRHIGMRRFVNVEEAERRLNGGSAVED